MRADGNAIAEKKLVELEAKAKSVPSKKIAFVMIGDNPASDQFVARKMKVAERLGVQTDIVRTDVANILLQLRTLHAYDGVVIQLPLPDTLNTDEVLNALPLYQDIDVLSYAAKEKYKNGTLDRMPPVAFAVDSMLKEYGIVLENKKIVIIGKGRLVGEPVALMFDRMKIAYMAVDEHTLESEKNAAILDADIIISGTGVPQSIAPDMVKDGVVLIDAGTSEQSGKLVGDIDPECDAKASLYTPVPGGVGPLTVVGIFTNLLL